MTMLKQGARASSIKGCRRIHSSTCVYAEPSKNSKEGAQAEEAPKRRGIKAKRMAMFKWLSSPEGGMSFATKQEGINWMGNTLPFPNNRTFKPLPPLPEKDKTEIWRWYSRKTAPRIIAERFKISVKRVEAILRLKALENDMVKKGKPIQHKLASAMESMLGARSRLNSESDPLYEITQRIGSPEFVIREEGEAEMSQEDAAKILGTTSMKKIEETIAKREKEHPFMLTEKADIEKTEELKPRNPLLSNSRFKFVFVNTSKEGERETTIRNQDGSLHKLVVHS